MHTQHTMMQHVRISLVPLFSILFSLREKRWAFLVMWNMFWDQERLCEMCTTRNLKLLIISTSLLLTLSMWCMIY